MGRLEDCEEKDKKNAYEKKLVMEGRKLVEEENLESTRVNGRKDEDLQCVVWLKVENVLWLKVLVDTGAQFSMTSNKILNKLEKLVGVLKDMERDMELASGISGKIIRVDKCKKINIQLGKKKYDLKAHAVEGFDGYDLIMGLDFLVENELDIFPSQAMLKTKRGEVIKLHMKKKKMFNYAVSKVLEADEEIRLQNPLTLEPGQARLIKVVRNGRRIKPALEAFWKKKGISVFCQHNKFEIDAVYIHITNTGNRNLILEKGVRIALIFGVSHFSWQSWYQQVRKENLQEAIEMSKAEENGIEYKRSHVRHHELARRRSESAHCLYKNDLGIFYREAPYYDLETRQNMLCGKPFIEIKSSRSKSLDPEEFKRLDSSRIFACEHIESKKFIWENQRERKVCQTFVAKVIQPWLTNGNSEFTMEEVEAPTELEKEEALKTLDDTYDQLMKEEIGDAQIIERVGEVLVIMAEDKQVLECKNGLYELRNCEDEPISLGDPESADIGEADTRPEMREAMLQVLRDHPRQVLSGGNQVMDPIKGVKCDLELKPGGKPVRTKVRPVAHKHLAKLYDLIRTMVKSGMLKFSISEWASAIVIVMKKDGVNIRLCVDYSEANKQWVRHHHPLPKIDDLLSFFHGCLWFSELDMANGYWGVLLTERASQYMSFHCPLGAFRPTRMMLGVHNSGAIYQGMMNCCLYGAIPDENPGNVSIENASFQEDEGALQTKGTGKVDKLVKMLQESDLQLARKSERKSSIILDASLKDEAPLENVAYKHSFDPEHPQRSYVDDVALGTKTQEQHVQRFRDLFVKLKRWAVSVNLIKCHCMKHQIVQMSMSVNKEGLRAEPKNLEQIVAMRFPIDLRGMQVFLGSFIYFRRFLPCFSGVAALLYSMKEKDFLHPSESHIKCFEQLKQDLQQSQTIVHPDLGAEFHVLIYSNSYSVGGTLLQLRDDILQPVGFASRILNECESKFEDVEKDIVALLRMVKEFYSILRAVRFTVWSKQKNLKWYFSSSDYMGGRAEQFKIRLSCFEFCVRMTDSHMLALPALLAASVLSPKEYSEALRDFAPDRSTISRMVKGAKPTDMHKIDFVASWDGTSSSLDKIGTCSGIIWKLPEWDVIWQCGKPLGLEVTVNQSEYEGLLMVLEKIQELKLAKIAIFGDSQLIVEQSNGNKKVMNEKLQKLHSKVQMLLLDAEILPIPIYHILREFNASADHLASCAKLSGGLCQVDVNLLRELNRLPEYINDSKRNEDDKLTNEEIESDGVSMQIFNMTAVENRPQLIEDLDLERRRRISLAQDAEEELLNLKKLLRNNSEDMPTKDWMKKNRKKEWDYILLEDNLLCRIWEDKLSFRGKTYVQVVIPNAIQDYIIRSYHAEEFGGHLGATKTYIRLRKSFYWSGMYTDVEKFVKSCYICQCCLNSGGGRSASPGNVEAMYPMHIMAMDIVSKLPKSESGATNCIVFVDIFTGFCWAFPMNLTNAQECAKKIMKVFAQVGPCNTLRHDRDKRFLSSLVDSLRSIWNIHQLATLAYNPKGDGHVERKIGVIQLLLRKLVEDALQRDWESQLDRVCFSLNISYDSERKETPFYLMHGWDPKSALESGLQIPGDNETTDAKAWRLERNEEMLRVQKLVQIHYREVQLKRAKKTEVEQRGKPFKIGDRVWVFDPKYGQDENRKLSARWNGPFRIQMLKPDRPFMYKIDARDNITHEWIKYERLKLCTDPDHKPFLDPINIEILRNLDEELPGHELAVDLEYEVEVEEILEARVTRPAKHSHPRHEFKVKLKDGAEHWIDYDSLNCDHLVRSYLARNDLPTLSHVSRRQRGSEEQQRRNWYQSNLGVIDENEELVERDILAEEDENVEEALAITELEPEDEDGISRVIDEHEVMDQEAQPTLAKSSRGRTLKPRIRLNLLATKIKLGLKWNQWLKGLKAKFKMRSEGRRG